MASTMEYPSILKGGVAEADNTRKVGEADEAAKEIVEDEVEESPK